MYVYCCVVISLPSLIEHEEKKWRHVEEPPEDDLEVMRPEHFILPACILLGGLTAASITFLCEILYNRKYRGKNTTDIGIQEALEKNKGTTIISAKDNTKEATITTNLSV